jgi:phosphatidylinositol glycan class O
MPSRSKVESVSVIAFLSFCIIVGSLVFSRGFLLNRQIVHETAGPCLHSSRAVHIRSSSSNNNEQIHIPILDNENNNGLLGGMSNWCNPSPAFPKLVLILVDALRFDFVQRMEFLSTITKHSSSHHQNNDHTRISSSYSSCVFKFVADPPTTTMQRLKALMTGTMPTFIDASANFNRLVIVLINVFCESMFFMYLY